MKPFHQVNVIVGGAIRFEGGKITCLERQVLVIHYIHIQIYILTHTHTTCIHTHAYTHFTHRMPQLRILLINTKVPRSTKKMVSGVRERYDKVCSI